MSEALTEMERRGVKGLTRLVRRSGVAVCQIAYFLDWSPEAIYQVGLGFLSQEWDVFREMWGCEFKLVGYEANPSLVEKLKNYPGEVRFKALYSHETTMTLHWRTSHRDGGSFFIPDGQAAAEVKTSTLDVEHPNGPESRNVMLWLDCEGSELAVLEGGKEFIKQVDMVNVELTARPRGDGWCDHVAVHDWLEQAGFLRQWIHTQRQSAGQFDAIYVRPYIFREQYCCDPVTVKRVRK